MTRLETVLNKCKKQCDALKIPYGNVVQIVPSQRVTRKWGSCRVAMGMNFITINKRLLEKDVSENALQDTVMHELLHTCPGCANHGNTWKYYAELVNRAYGYQIKRCTSAEEKGISIPEKKVNIKYRFRCKKCGKIVERQRASAFTRAPEKYRCAVCGGEFEKIR